MTYLIRGVLLSSFIATFSESVFASQGITLTAAKGH